MEGSYDTARIAVLDLTNGSYRTLVSGASEGRYVPSGHLVYVRGGTIYAVPFDLKRLAITGRETPVIEGVYYNSGGGYADYAFSDSGLLLYILETRPTSFNTFDWVDRRGTSQSSAIPAQRGTGRLWASGSDVRVSPDGQRAAVVLAGGVGAPLNVWIADLSRGTLSPLSAEGASERPVWTPDGRHVAYTKLRGTRGIYWAPADGSGKPELLVATPAFIAFPDSWTPDGNTLLYESVLPTRIWTFTLPSRGGDGKPRMLFETGTSNVGLAQVSPDGRWVAYVSDESGKNQVYVQPFPGGGGKTPISIEGGEDPRWSRDGREIFYLDPAKNQVMAVDILAGPALRAGQPHALFEQRTQDWDVAPDGKRFLVRRVPQTEPDRAKLQVVVNWFEELRLKAPVGK
jgi:Tol biopolymer transport system component